LPQYSQLEFRHSHLGHEQCILLRFRLGAHPAVSVERTEAVHEASTGWSSSLELRRIRPMQKRIAHELDPGEVERS
jgi:hypothetical protein